MTNVHQALRQAGEHSGPAAMTSRLLGASRSEIGLTEAQ